MGREINIGAVIAGLYEMKQFARPSDAVGVVKAISSLRKTCLPDAYVDALEDELLQMISQPFPAAMTVNVYLSFHGAESRATYMKVGVARNVTARMREIATGNPLPRLWTYSAPFGGRSRAMRIERLLLDHMGADRVKGEWVKVAGLSESAAQSVVESLAEVASAHASQPVAFSRLGA